jgi:hypothetical protein
MKVAKPLMIAATKLTAFVTPDVEHVDLPEVGELVRTVINS